MEKFQVYWDNGNNACGTFEQVFDTFADAEAFAEQWLGEMAAADPAGARDYSAEVVPAA